MYIYYVYPHIQYKNIVPLHKIRLRLSLYACIYIITDMPNVMYSILTSKQRKGWSPRFAIHKANILSSHI